MERLNKGFATEIILTVGVLIASGILLLQLRGVFYGQTRLSQEEVASAFADDLENIVDMAVAVTGNASFVYYPAIKSYTLTVKNDTVLIYDKISKKTASFTKTSINLQDMIFEDSEIIYIIKVEDSVYILGKCKERGESCSYSIMCCPENPYCWGSPFVCHENCADLGENAADDEACCSGLFLNTSTGKCEKIPCKDDGKCEKFECPAGCKDCIGPNPICIGDGACTVSIEENCENSPVDCSCSIGICCPDHPDVDEKGCSLTAELDLNKGERCYCDAQCKAGLKCNPTAPGFTGYAKACCEPGKGWDGNDCIVLECEYPCLPGCILPNYFDWRNYKGGNWMSPVRSQARCGSCWIFSAVGAVEGTYNIEQGNPNLDPDLSEQDLVSCGPGGGCMGGYPHVAINYIHTTGICDEACFPYQDINTGIGVKTRVPCSSKCGDWNNRLWKIRNYGRVSSDINEIKRAIICHGPLSVGSDNWKHAIVLAGYDDARQRWIIKNSWGIGWNDRGYGYIPYSGHAYSDIRNYVYYVENVIPP